MKGKEEKLSSNEKFNAAAQIVAFTVIDEMVSKMLLNGIPIHIIIDRMEGGIRSLKKTEEITGKMQKAGSSEEMNDIVQGLFKEYGDKLAEFYSNRRNKGTGLSKDDLR